MTPLQKVQLTGDSIALAYAPLVAEMLAGSVRLHSPPANAGDSANLLSHIDEWVLRSPPDLLVLNCGLHDLKRLRPAGTRQQPPETCWRNLRTIFQRLAPLLPVRVIWATIIPVIFERHRARKDFDRHPADVAAYNKTALEVVKPLGVRVVDLHQADQRAGVEECLSEDGVHMNERGNLLLAREVARAVREAIAG